jgi:NAD+ synthase (glutamine-hydrolysing)
MDLLFDQSYIQQNVLALEKIRKATEGITAIVGYARPELGATMPGGRPLLYNSAAVMRDGVIVAVQDKSLLPVYDIFDESRYFAPGNSRQVIEVGGIKLGLVICEDLWSDGYKTDPTAELAAQGAEIIVSLNASPFNVGKLPVRAGLIENATTKHKLPFIYTNLVGAYDGYEGEVVFDGRSIIMGPNGKLLGVGQTFKEELLFVDIHRPKELTLPALPEVEELHGALVLGIRDWFYRAGKARGQEPSQAVLGLSGGIDSAVVAALAAEALGPNRVLAISMPTRYNSAETKSDAEKTAPLSRPSPHSSAADRRRIGNARCAPRGPGIRTDECNHRGPRAPV